MENLTPVNEIKQEIDVEGVVPQIKTGGFAFIKVEQDYVDDEINEDVLSDTVEDVDQLESIGKNNCNVTQRSKMEFTFVEAEEGLGDDWLKDADNGTDPLALYPTVEIKVEADCNKDGDTVTGGIPPRSLQNIGVPICGKIENELCGKEQKQTENNYKKTPRFIHYIRRSESDRSATTTSTFRKRRNYTGEKPFKCSQPNCTYSAWHSCYIKLYQRVHTGIGKFKCDQCNFSASYSNHLTIHQRSHSGKRPFKCTVCDYAGKAKSNLNNHMRRHTGEKPYKCDECDYSALQSIHLKRYKTCHSVMTHKNNVKP